MNETAEVIEQTETQEVEPLTEIFGGEPETGDITPVTPTEVEPQPEETKGEETTETPSDEPEKTEDLESKTDEEPEKTEKDIGLEKALIAERRKRQDLEDQLRATQQPQPGKKDFWDDPEGLIDQKLNTIKADNTKKLLNLSAAQAAKRYDDYLEKEQVFIEMVNDNPNLAYQMINEADPAEFVYQTVKNHQFMTEIGQNPEEYREKLKAELRAEIETEVNNRVADKIKTAAKLPPSAESLKNKTVKTAPIVGDNPLKEIFEE